VGIPTVGIAAQFAILGDHLLWRSADDQVTRGVTAIWRQGYEGDEFSGQRFVQNRVTAEVRISEIASAADGDELQIQGQWWRVKGEPTTDELGLVWMLSLVLSEEE